MSGFLCACHECTGVPAGGRVVSGVLKIILPVVYRCVRMIGRRLVPAMNQPLFEIRSRNVEGQSCQGIRHWQRCSVCSIAEEFVANHTLYLICQPYAVMNIKHSHMEPCSSAKFSLFRKDNFVVFQVKLHGHACRVKRSASEGHIRDSGRGREWGKEREREVDAVPFDAYAISLFFNA